MFFLKRTRSVKRRVMFKGSFVRVFKNETRQREREREREREKITGEWK